MLRQKRAIIYSIIFIFAAGVLYCVKGNSGSIQEELATGEPAVSSFVKAVQTSDSVVKKDESEKSKQQACCYVCGAVKKPGVYQFETGARLNEVIQLAGGYSKEAAENYLNLAKIVQDSEKIYVPSKEEVNSQAAGTNGENEWSLQENTEESDQTGVGKVNINSADIDKLTSLPGIGEAKANSILSYRTEHGAFQSIEDLKNVEGIKDGVYNKVKDLISI